jgi:hypothetical protein
MGRDHLGNGNDDINKAERNRARGYGPRLNPQIHKGRNCGLCERLLVSKEALCLMELYVLMLYNV